MLLKPAETVEIYQAHGSPKTFKAGEVIFSQGDKGDVMYGVIEGEVEMQVNGKPIETIEAGDIFGVGAILHPDHSRASTAIAKTDCTLAYLDIQRFLFVIEQTPVFAVGVMRNYSDRFRRLKADL